MPCGFRYALHVCTRLAGSQRSGTGAALPTLCASRSLVTSRGSSSSPTFSLGALPLELQREFDPEANRLTLKHLCRTHQRPQGTVSGASVAIAVKPTWTHIVTWRCASCHRSWDARPADRVDPQVGDQHSCPNCAAERAAAALPAATASHTREAQIEMCEDAYAEPASAVDQHASGHRRTWSPLDIQPRARSLMAAYPALAGQWDLTRNEVPSNRVGESASTVPVTSSTQVWWSCPLCAQCWRESVRGRISRFHKGQQQYGKDFIPLCPSCETRGAERRVQLRRSQDGRAPSVTVKAVLADEPVLLAEAQLRPHQNPAEIALTAETILNWKCRFCEHDFQASVASRYVRYERCPQCTGKVRTPYNLVVIQRPDVLREVARTISRTALSYVTIHDEKPLPFVCRTCFSPYRMSARARCAVPKGGIACPKCLLNASQVVNQLIESSPAAPSRTSRKGKRVPRWKAAAEIHRRGRRERSGETLRITQNELQMRDHGLRD